MTTDSNHRLPIAANLQDRNFTPDQPNAVRTSDITYTATDEGRLYLAAVIDLYCRQVVGWSMQSHMETNLVSDAMWMAWFRRRSDTSLIFHSDRGILQPCISSDPDRVRYAKLDVTQWQLPGKRSFRES